MASSTGSTGFARLGDHAAVSSGLARLRSDESGQDVIEYALVLCLVAMGAVASMHSLASSIATTFAAVGTTLSNGL